MSKIDRIIQLAKDISHQIVQSPDHWKQYLNTAARVYKYPFRDQLFIYAQKPEATACASMKLWNDKMGCWINRGAKGIALLHWNNPNKLQYIFDVSDVHPSQSGHLPNLWSLQKTELPFIQKHLEHQYDSASTTDFPEQLQSVIETMVESQALDLSYSILSLGNDSGMFGNLEPEIAHSHIQDTLRSSVLYTVYTRCGIPIPESLSFDFISEFDSLASLSELGTAVSSISKSILKEIEQAIKIQKTLQSPTT